MASVERTAYPRFPRLLTPQKLQKLFSPSKDEVEWVAALSRGEDRRLSLMVHLKCFQYLHFFQPVESIPPEVVEHVAGCMGFAPQQQIRYPASSGKVSLYRDHDKVRARLKIRSYGGPQARAEAVRIARRASAVVNTVVDVINALTTELVIKDYELPSFNTLQKIAEKEHEAAEQAIFDGVERKLNNDQRRWLDELLISELSNWQTRFNELKRSAKKASRQHLDELLEQLGWLESLPDSDALLEGLTQPRHKYLCDLATTRDAGEMKDISQAKRHTLT